ncbi:hypothetical protein BT96DRAFT_1091188 [Gymnopus androsaceus JB14]|uniref:Uncharacterized protein n=1 Tax=Gymnopus androsaceus JB14 TaxID=1447944 RepID=A0A6A4HX85_9AGAR|nr:hypothetical protein BT96DRAFT_1091188 [Gymnopus androsaceus JB14]
MPSQTNFSVVVNTVHIHPQPGSTINITVTPTSPGPLCFMFEFPGNSIHQWRNSIEADGSVVPDSEPARLEELEQFNEQEQNDTAVRYQSLVAAGVLANSPTPSPVKTFLNMLKHSGVFSPTTSPLKNFEDMLDRNPGHCSPVENLSARANVRL